MLLINYHTRGISQPEGCFNVVQRTMKFSFFLFSRPDVVCYLELTGYIKVHKRLYTSLSLPKVVNINNLSHHVLYFLCSMSLF